MENRMDTIFMNSENSEPLLIADIMDLRRSSKYGALWNLVNIIHGKI